MDKAVEATLILVRHGETEWNAEGRIQGQADSPLTEAGLEQARQTARSLADLTVAAVYSSDAGRARETAVLLAAPHGVDVETRKGLRERCFGVLEGLTLDEARRRDSALVERWLADRINLAPPGGETEGEMCERVLAVLREVAVQHLGETVLLSTHGGPIKSAVLRVLRAPMSSWDLTWVANGSITTVRGTPDLLRLASYNDTCHLDREPQAKRYV